MKDDFRLLSETILFMIRFLLNLDILPKLTPKDSTISYDKSANFWRVSNEYAVLSLNDEVQISGWYMLEFDVKHDSSIALAELIVDAPNSLEGIRSITLPLRSNKLCKRVVYFSNKTKINGIRFTSVGLGFLAHKLSLVRLAPWFAIDRILQRIVNTHLCFRGDDKRSAWRRIREEASVKVVSKYQIVLDYYSDTFSVHCSNKDYNRWLKNKEINLKYLPQERAKKTSDFRPLISILMPVYNPSLRYLRQAIDSVISQSYSNWELCVADDASTNPEVWSCLQIYAKKSKRIKVVFRSENGHISAASNSAFSLATGAFIGFLDHDDTLSYNALEEVVSAIDKHKETLLVYSDEDKLDQSGARFEPHFKPGWNPDLILSQNYICHFLVLKSELIRKLNGFREGVDGSQDHDLLLRCMPYLNSEVVTHIPKILYHWRAIPGSTAESGLNKQYAMDTGLYSVKDYIQRETLPAKVECGAVPNTYRIRWNIPSPCPKISLLIPTRDEVGILKSCIETILKKTNYSNFEILILDNQSTCKDTLKFFRMIESDSRVSIHPWNYPFNYSAINNFGASRASGDFLGLINNDIEPVNESWLGEMLSHACRPEIGCVGAKLYYPNDTIQHGGVILGIGGVAGHSHKYFKKSDYGYFSRLQLVQNLSAVTGACLLLKKSIFEEVGGLDENLPVAYNDVDLCLRVREAGYRNLWTPYAELYHHESISRGADDTPSKRRRAKREASYMRHRWGIQLDNDPAYNPNLTLIHEDFSLA